MDISLDEFVFKYTGSMFYNLIFKIQANIKMAIGDSGGKYVSNIINHLIGAILFEVYLTIGSFFALLGNWEFGLTAVTDVMTNYNVYDNVGDTYLGNLSYEE